MRNIRSLGLAALGFGGLVGSALADVPTAFTTAITDMTADGTAMGGALVGVAAAVAVVLLAVSYVKKIRGAAK